MPKPKPAAPSATAAPPWLRAVLLVLCAVLLLGWFSREFSDSDSWWQLKTGQYIVQHRALPIPDPFSYTAYMGQPVYPGEARTRDFNLTHSWLSQVMFYAAYAAGGFPALILLRAALLALFCGLVGVLAWLRSRSFYRALAAALAAAFIADRFIADRPFLVTMVFLALTMVLFELYAAGRRRVLWLLPPLFLLWANFHGGYFVGWTVPAAWCAQALYQRRRDVTIYAASSLAILASGLNPNFFAAIPVMFAYRQSVLQSALIEWQYTALWPLEPFGVLLAAAVVVLILAARKVRPVDWLLFVLYTALAIGAVRNVFLIGLVAPVLIAAYLPGKRALPAVGEWAVAVLLVAAIAFGIVRGTSFQLRAAEWKYPHGAAAFLESHRIAAPMFNTYEDGGYLMWRLWPMQKVFIDGRALNESVALDYRRIAYNADATGGKTADQLLDQYGIQVILMPGFNFSSGDVYLLPASLADPSQTKWKLVYQDAQGMVFMRQPPPGVEPLNSLAALSSLESQCAAYVEHDPAHPRCARALGDLFTKIGDAARARQWLSFYLDRRNEPDPEADRMYRALLGR